MIMKNRSPNCGHSACCQYFIDTGEIRCLEDSSKLGHQLLANAADVARVVVDEALPTSDEQRAGVHELLTVGDKLIFRQADGRVITIKARNRNPLDDALAALIAFACGAAVALLVSTLLGSVQ
jgi:hypothetical protein